MRETPKLKELEAAVDAADKKLRDIRDRVEREQSEETEKILASIAAKYAAQIAVARKECSDACEQYISEKERVALLAEDAPWPLGTKLVEWGRKGACPRSSDPLVPLRTGVLEVLTCKSERPDNFSGLWNVHEIGSYIIRILKNDGTPSKEFFSAVFGYRRSSWYPEGVDPNTGADNGAREEERELEQ